MRTKLYAQDTQKKYKKMLRKCLVGDQCPVVRGVFFIVATGWESGHFNHLGAVGLGGKINKYE